MRPLTLLLLPFLFGFQLVCAQDPFPAVRGKGGFYVDGFEKQARDLSCLEGFQTLALIIPIEAIPNADSYYMYMSATHSSLGDLFRNYSWEMQVSRETFRSHIYMGHFFMWILHPTEGYFKTAKSITSFLDKEILCSAPKSKSIDIKFSLTGYNKIVVTKYDADCKCSRTYVSETMSFSSTGHTYYCSVIPDNEKTREAYPGVSPKTLGPVPVLPGRGGWTVNAPSTVDTPTAVDTPTYTEERSEPTPAKPKPQAPPKPVDRYVKEMRDNGTIRREGQLVNELQVGTWKEYYPNGKMSVESNYVAGNLHGFKTEWDEEGNKESVAEYQNGKLLGRQEEYYNGKLRKEYTKGADGLEGICKEYSGSYLVSQKNFVQGVQQGEERAFSSTDGSLEEIFNYVNGKLHGVYQEFQGGVLVEEGAYESGEKSGTWKHYYWPAGKLKEQYQLQGEQKVGAYKGFNLNGKVAKEGQYASDGKATGDWTEYNDAGKISMTYTYVNGVYHGPYKIYHEGKVIKTVNYLNGVPQQ